MEYVVEKLIDGEWYYEGKGPIEYVNRIGSILSRQGIVFRVVEVEEHESTRQS